MYQGVILVGPGQGFFTFNTHENPHFSIEIFNISILGRSVLWLSECCNEIFILALPCYEKLISELINTISDQLPVRSSHINTIRDLKNLTGGTVIPIYFVSVRSYDGTIKSLLMVRKYLTGNFISTKGNIITTVPLSSFIRQNVFTIMTEQNEPVLVGCRNNKIVLYDPSFELQIGELDGDVQLLYSWDTAQIYFFTKEMVNFFDPKLYSMKNLIPVLLKKFPLRFCKAYKGNFINVKGLSDLYKAFTVIRNEIIDSGIVKRFSDSELSVVENFNRHECVEKRHFENNIHGSPTKCLFLYFNNNKRVSFTENTNIVGPEFKSHGHVINIVAGENCYVGEGSVVSESILMDNVYIGKNCEIKDSIIGSGVVVRDNSKIRNCKVSPGYVFRGDVHISDVIF